MAFIIHAEDIQHSAGNRRWHLRKKPLKMRDRPEHNRCKTIVTTHTPMLARYLDETDLRFIQRGEDGTRSIIEGSEATSAEIAKSLGVLPDHNVKIFIGVEGPHDIAFLKGISRILIAAGEEVCDLEKLEIDGELIFVPLGGSNLALWASRLAPFNRPEFHICDRDNSPPSLPKYADHMDAVNARAGCQAVATQKRELESYLHHEAISEAYAINQINIAFAAPFSDFDDVPKIVAQAVHEANSADPWADLDEEKRRKKESAVKRCLNNAAISRMNLDRLAATDPQDEIRGWLARISQMMVAVDM